MNGKGIDAKFECSDYLFCQYDFFPHKLYSHRFRRYEYYASCLHWRKNKS